MAAKPVMGAFNQGLTPTIACFNQAKTPLGVDFAKLVAALQLYIDSYIVPVWATPAKLAISTGFLKGSWALVFLDDADQAGALAYHELTPDGLPISKVFVRTTLQNGELVSVSASHELCLTGDTKISLLDGTDVPIEQLVGREPFWVYSVTEDGTVRPGKAHSARCTGKNVPIVTVTLDDGQVVRCTENERFMLRNGKYAEASDLQPGDSLMPLYRRRAILDREKAKGRTMYEYEQVLVPKTNTWEYTHRVIQPHCPSGYVRHHANFNRFDNSPDNLQILEWEAHRKLHSDHIKEVGKAQRGKRKNYSAEGLKKAKENWRRNGDRLAEYNVSQKHRDDMERYYGQPGVREKHGKQMHDWAKSEENKKRVTLLNQTQEKRLTAAKSITTYNKSDKHRKVAAELGRQMFLSPKFDLIRSQNGFKTSHERWHVQRGIKNPTCAFCCTNHKVVSVVSSGGADVFDFTVDKYHNFALSAGVFVHNCEMLVDPAINLMTTGPDPRAVYAYEACDPCEALSFPINGIQMSDFILPAYFEIFHPTGSVKFDAMGKVSRPFQLLAGGYQIVFKSGRWTQIFGSKTKEKQFKKEDRRGHRSEERGEKKKIKSKKPRAKK